MEKLQQRSCQIWWNFCDTITLPSLLRVGLKLYVFEWVLIWGQMSCAALVSVMSSKRKIPIVDARCFSLLRGGVAIVQNRNQGADSGIHLHSFQWICKSNQQNSWVCKCFRSASFLELSGCDRVTKGSEPNLTFICNSFLFHWLKLQSLWASDSYLPILKDHVLVLGKAAAYYGCFWNIKIA